MATLQGFPYFPVEFTKDGTVADPAQVDALVAGLTGLACTDLLVISHGWNNDMDEAQNLYDAFFAQFRQALGQPNVPAFPPRAFAVLGVLWPSKKFADAHLIPGGAAGAVSPITLELLAAALDRLHGTFDAPGADAVLEAAKQLLPYLEDQASARKEFAEKLRSVLPQAETSPDVDAADTFFALPGDELMDHLSKPFPAALLAPTMPMGPAAAIGASPVVHLAGLSQFFGGVLAGALNLLNYATYYQMKERAGSVGRLGVHAVLQRVRGAAPIRLHLMGHSFGGRVVTAAAAGPAETPVLPVSTLTLLQAAFSHYGFSDDYDGTHAGFFRRVVTDRAVAGPVLITHSVRDTAVGTLYPLASMLAHQVGAALGDANDQYGGMGRNGAQKTPEATEGPLLGPTSKYAFAGGRIYNLNADNIIQEHSDICHPEVANALLQAIGITK